MLVAAACGSKDTTVEVPHGTPVILISIDTLRSDRLPAYGYGGVSTPAIDALRRDSILFDHAYSHVPLTLPSHTSILTGMLPGGHQVRDNMGYQVKSADLPSLPRTLKKKGYSTGAAVSSFVLRASTGIAADFDFYDDEIEVRTDTSLGGMQRSGTETLAAARAWLDSVNDKPFFFFFHIYEPHTPHAPPEPFASQYRNRYDGEVAAADRVVGELIRYLQQVGVYDRALIILLSDHGEGLWDHGTLEHMVLLYREIIQVPLMIKLPGSHRAGDSVTQTAQLSDILPTVFDLLAIEIPERVDGVSLLGLDPEGQSRRVYSETHYPRLHFGWSQLASLTDGRYQYIHGPDPELYDLEVDPGETSNILRQQRRVYGEMKQDLEAYDLEIQTPSEVDPEAQEKLAALGYLGSVGAASTGPLADPKTRLHVLEDLQEARRAFNADDFDRTIEILSRVVDEEPLLTDAWQQLAKSYGEIGQLEEAEAAVLEAMRLSSGAPQVAHIAAEVYKSMGRLEEAKAHAELATSASESAWDLLAQITIEQGEFDEAETYIQESMKRRGTRIGPLLTLAALRVAQDRLQECIDLTFQAEKEFGDNTDRSQLDGMFFTRGKAYTFLGDVENAERTFLAGIEHNPRALGPYTHLAFLYALEGESGKAGSTLRQMVENNPNPTAHAAAVVALREMGDERSASAVLAMARNKWPDNQQLRGLEG